MDQKIKTARERLRTLRLPVKKPIRKSVVVVNESAIKKRQPKIEFQKEDLLREGDVRISRSPEKIGSHYESTCKEEYIIGISRYHKGSWEVNRPIRIIYTKSKNDRVYNSGGEKLEIELRGVISANYSDSRLRRLSEFHEDIRSRIPGAIEGLKGLPQYVVDFARLDRL